MVALMPRVFGRQKETTVKQHSLSAWKIFLLCLFVVALEGALTCAHAQYRVRAVGDNSANQLGRYPSGPYSIPVAVSNLTDIIAVSAGGNHSLALKADGTVWAWGDNSSRELGDGTTIPH